MVGLRGILFTFILASTSNAAVVPLQEADPRPMQIKFRLSPDAGAANHLTIIVQNKKFAQITADTLAIEASPTVLSAEETLVHFIVTRGAFEAKGSARVYGTQPTEVVLKDRTSGAQMKMSIAVEPASILPK